MKRIEKNVKTVEIEGNKEIVFEEGPMCTGVPLIEEEKVSKAVKKVKE